MFPVRSQVFITLVSASLVWAGQSAWAQFPGDFDAELTSGRRPARQQYETRSFRPASYQTEDSRPRDEFDLGEEMFGSRGLRDLSYDRPFDSSDRDFSTPTSDRDFDRPSFGANRARYFDAIGQSVGFSRLQRRGGSFGSPSDRDDTWPDDSGNNFRSNRLPLRNEPSSDDSYGMPWQTRRPVDRMPPMNQRDPWDNGNSYQQPAPYQPLVQPQAPLGPTTPAPQPTMGEKITRRFSDPRVQRILGQLNSQRGESFYLEVLQLVDNRHIQPTDYSQRMENGVRYLQEGLFNQAFLTATATTAQPQREQLAAALDQLPVRSIRSQNETVQLLRQADALCQQAGLRPGTAAMAFVYGMLDTLDPYSLIMPAEKSGSADLGLGGQVVGIGVEVEAHERGLKILKAISGGPASEAKLRKGDLITAVDGQSVAGFELQQAVERITGPAGSPIRLDLRRENQIGNVTLTRRTVQLRSISEVRLVDQNSGVGYIKMEQFAESTTQELDRALWSLHEQGMQSLVLDLRGNPGGLLTTAIAVADRFLPAGTIVSTRGRTQGDNTLESAQRAETWNMPLVVIVDHDSASASEILAAAVQENRRGIVVGERSYGKGTVQTLFPLQSVGAALRLTTAKFYSPNGREMAGQGVSPDVVLRDVANDEIVIDESANIARDPQTRQLSEQFQQTGQRDLKQFRIAI